MTDQREFVDDGETLHTVGQAVRCAFCGNASHLFRYSAFIWCGCKYTSQPMRHPRDEYFRRVSNTLATVPRVEREEEQTTAERDRLFQAWLDRKLEPSRADSPKPTAPWRVGTSEPANIYLGDERRGQMRYDEDGPRVVAALNENTWPSLRGALELAQEENGQLRAELTKVKSDWATAEQQWETAAEHHERTEAKLKEVCEERDRAIAERDTAWESRNQLRRHLEESQAGSRRLSADNARLRDERDQARAELAKENNELGPLRHFKATHETECPRRATIRRLEDELAGVKTALRGMTGERDGERRIATGWEQKYEDVKAELGFVKDKQGKANAECERLTKELEAERERAAKASHIVGTVLTKDWAWNVAVVQLGRAIELLQPPPASAAKIPEPSAALAATLPRLTVKRFNRGTGATVAIETVGHHDGCSMSDCACDPIRTLDSFEPNGATRADDPKCSACGSSGRITVPDGFSDGNDPCPTCRGSGNAAQNSPPDAQADGTQREQSQQPGAQAVPVVSAQPAPGGEPPRPFIGNVLRLKPRSSEGKRGYISGLRNAAPYVTDANGRTALLEAARAIEIGLEADEGKPILPEPASCPECLVVGGHKPRCYRGRGAVER